MTSDLVKMTMLTAIVDVGKFNLGTFRGTPIAESLRVGVNTCGGGPHEESPLKSLDIPERVSIRGILCDREDS